MANSELIDTIVDRASVSGQITQTTAELQAMQQALADNLRAANQLNAALGQSRNFSQLQNSAARAEAELAKLQREIVRLQTEQQKLAREIANTTAAEQRAERETLRTTQAQQRAAQQTRTNATEYQKLVRAFNEATAAAREAGVTYGTTSTQFTTAANRVRELRAQLDAIDNPLGNFQRNVGNYANSIGGLFNRAFGALRTFANIVPGLGISGIFLYIGQGIAYAADKLGIFSFKAKEALTDAQKYTKEAADNVVGDFAKLNTLYDASQNANLPLKERLAVIAELQREYPAYFGNLSKEAILAGQAATAYDNLTNSLIQKAIISAGQKNLEDQLKPLIELKAELNRQQVEIDKQNAAAQARNPNKITSFSLTDANGKAIPGIRDVVISGARKRTRSNGDFIVDENGDLQTINSYQSKLTAKIKDANKAIQLALEDFGINGLLDPDKKKEKERAKKVDKSFDDRLAALKAAEEKVLNSESATYDERIAAINIFEQRSDEVIKQGIVAKVYRAQEGANKISEIDALANKQRLKVADDAQKELVRIFKEGIKNQEEILKNSLAVADQFREQQLSQAQADTDNSLIDLADAYQKGLITTQQYQKKKAEIEAQNRINIDAAEIAALELRIQIGKSLNEDTLADENKLAAAKRKLAKDVADTQINEAERVAARQKELRAKEKELAESAANFVISLVEAGYERRKNEIQDKKDKIDVETQAQIDAENRSLDNTQQKADKINIINAQAAAKKALLDQQQRKADQEKAKFDKAVSIARIIENTATGITSALAQYPPNVPLSIIIGAIGAVQLATVAAQPIPKYAKGVKSKPTDGPMLVGEAGSELVKNPDGSMYITNRPTLTYGLKGTEVVPHMQLMGMMRTGEIKVKGEKVFDDRRIIKAIKEQRQPKTNVYVRGFSEKFEVRRRNYWN